MNAVFTIAKRDLKSYVASLKGAVIFWFFLIITGVFFYNFVVTFVNLQQQAGMSGGEAPTVEQLMSALFQNIHFVILLVIPAITMGTFAEEKRSGAEKLLATSPVSASQIVFGKFFGAMGMMGMLLLASTVFPLYTLVYGNPDIGPLLTGYLGLFLLIGAQVSLGLWISSLTSNQFIAFVFTMFGLFLLLILNWIAPNVSGGGNFESFVKYLAFTTHLDSLFKGVLQVSSITYFVLFIGTFLFFTNVSLDSQRWR